jgi:hypothetical protein
MANNWQKINGKSFTISIGGLPLYVNKFSLEISDESAVAMKRGRPDGWLKGNVAGSGEIELDANEFARLSAAARAAGSWQNLPPFDVHTFALAGGALVNVEAFGCKLKLSSVLDVDDSAADKTVFTVPFDVTGEDFVHINGTPYAEAPFYP